MRWVGERFESRKFIDPDVDLGGVVFERCTFAGCRVMQGVDARRRVRVVDVTLTDSTVERGNTVTGTWLTDVTVRNLRCTGDVQFLNGCVFERVTLAGRIDRMVLNSEPVVVSDETRRAFGEEAAHAYAAMDWALDIREADTSELDIRNVPVDLVRRDPSTQAVVRGTNLTGKDWESIDFEETWFRSSLRSIVRGDETDVVLVTPTRKRDAAAFVRVIGRLRDAGIADPD